MLASSDNEQQLFLLAINEDGDEDTFNRFEFIRSLTGNRFQKDGCKGSYYSTGESTFEFQNLVIRLVNLIQKLGDYQLLLGLCALLESLVHEKAEGSAIDRLSNILICIREQKFWFGYTSDLNNMINENNQGRVLRALQDMTPIVDLINKLMIHSEDSLPGNLEQTDLREQMIWERERVRLNELNKLLVDLELAEPSLRYGCEHSENLGGDIKPQSTSPDGRIFEKETKRLQTLLNSIQASPDISASEQENILLSTLQAHGKIEGTVKEIRNNEAIIDIGGYLEGVLPAREITWHTLRNSASLLQTLEVGQKIETQIMRVDPKTKRVFLSARRTHNPYTEFEKGQIVDAKVIAIHPFGVFAKVDGGPIEGLIPVSKISPQRVPHPRDVLSKGDILKARIIDIDCKKEQLTLSLIGVKQSNQKIKKQEQKPATLTQRIHPRE